MSVRVELLRLKLLELVQSYLEEVNPTRAYLLSLLGNHNFLAFRLRVKFAGPCASRLSIFCLADYY